jgi:hypothetical protein
MAVCILVMQRLDVIASSSNKTSFIEKKSDSLIGTIGERTFMATSG